MTLYVRAGRGSPMQLTRSVATAVHGVDPRLAMTFRPLSEQVGASLTRERLVAELSGFFGSLAILLAAVGVFGVTSYSVLRRRSEIGIRVALGGKRSAVVRLMVSRVALPVGIGVIAGVVVSLWAVHVVSSMLYGLEPRDPSTVIGAAITLAFTAGLAAWLPARRAARVDPASTLRCE